MQKEKQDILVIEKATFQELAIIDGQWVNREGWNPGLEDTKCFWAADPNGFFVAKLNQKMVGFVSAVKYEQGKFGFIGLYIVVPEYRGKGYGLKLFNKGLQYLNGYNIGLDGVIQQQPNYKKSGFKHYLNHMRYQILGKEKPKDHIRNKLIQDIQLEQVLFKKIQNYDRQMFPSKREQFPKQLFKQNKSKALCCCNQQGSAIGYGVVRKSAQGYRIGPLYADTPQIASLLIEEFQFLVGIHEKIYIDVPDANQQAVNLMQNICSVSKLLECARMYTGDPPKVNTLKIYGNSTLELG